MTMQSKLWTLSALAVELGRDRRSLARDLEGLDPDESSTQGKRVDRRWRMARVFDHLMQSSGDLDLSQERARLAKAQADKTEIENEVRAGRLVEISQVINDVGAMHIAFRSRVLAIPDAVGQLLDAETSRIVVPAIRCAVHEALAELSQYRPGSPGAVGGNGRAAAEPDCEPVGGQRAATVQRGQCRAREVED